MKHDKLVEQAHEEVEETIEDSRWDEVHKEIPYRYTEENSPEAESRLMGHEKGEFDLLLIDRATATIAYVEAKSNSNDVQYGEDQVARAKKTFGEELGLNFMGEVILSPNDLTLHEAGYMYDGI